MKKFLALLCWLSAIHSRAQDHFQLARPLAKCQSVFFKGSTTLELKFALPGAVIYYTTDHSFPPGNGAEPGPATTRYKKPLLIKEPFTTIRAKVFCNGFEPSETISISFAREGKAINKISGTSPHTQYPGTGESTLFDNRGGMENLSSPTWMGFKSDSVSFIIELKEVEPVHSVLLSFLRREASWVFLPESISIRYFDAASNTYLPFGGELNESKQAAEDKVCLRLISTAKKDIRTNKLRVDLRPVQKIPAWHPAKGEHAWCFIDEIKVY